ncbi:hypothetical protein NHX12_002755, partial [Muraenolepis orangiensis]
MSDEDESPQKARTGFEDLCRALNMDEEASTEAWRSYEDISRNYTLEGSELHWLACALYVACRSSVPTVGKGTAEGNYVSLTRILRCSEQSVSQDFRQGTEKLERNFTVSAVIFKKYVPIFRSVFKAPPEEPPRVHRSRKQRRHPCTISEVFNFCWILFIHAKGLPEEFSSKDYRPILKGREDSLTGFLDPMNFGDSFASLSRVYEEHILATGSLDERIFTGEEANQDIGTPAPCLSDRPENQDTAARKLHTSLTASALKVSTPLSSRKYPLDSRLASPVSSAIQSVGRLHSLLTGATQGPSTKLAQILRACARDPSDIISTRLKEMFQTYSQHYEDESLEGEGMGKERLILGEADLSGILEQDIFHGSLMACCLEIVIFSYRPPGDFPSILNIFKIPAYHFYKVIEVLVRAEQGLFREVVKHLNQVEEQVVERLAWDARSPLWDALTRHAENHAPTCQEVMPPRYLEESEAGSRSRGSPSTPVTLVSRLADLTAGSTLKGVSPSPTSLLERYSSPIGNAGRRRLFLDTTDATSLPMVTMATATVTANNGQTVHIPVQANESGGIVFIQVSMTGQGGATLQPLMAQALTGSPAGQSVAIKTTTPQSKPACSGVALRKGSLSLFFRKVYHLASLRLRDLCAKLDISSELRQKIWTCFEYSLVHCTDLLKDRHLDQLLICAVYVMAKVTKEDRSFQNIMKCYRTQPQASSTEERGDLIRFYNQVYIMPMRRFALRYSQSSPSTGVDSPPLCPYPTLRGGASRRVLFSSKHC